MAFNYDPTNTGTQARDRIRLMVGDTVENGHRLDDEEIDAVLEDYGVDPTTDDPTDSPRLILLAAADCHRLIAAKLAKESEVALTEVGPVKNSAAESHEARAVELEGRAQAWISA